MARLEVRPSWATVLRWLRTSKAWKSWQRVKVAKAMVPARAPPWPDMVQPRPQAPRVTAPTSNPCQARRREKSLVKRLAWAGRGPSSMTPSSTGSTPRARAGRESVTRLSHKSCTGVRGVWGRSSAVARATAAISPMLQESR